MFVTTTTQVEYVIVATGITLNDCVLSRIYFQKSSYFIISLSLRYIWQKDLYWQDLYEEQTRVRMSLSKTTAH